MANWTNDFIVKYHITFVHNDGRSEVVRDNMIVEGRSPEEVKKIILAKYEHSSFSTTDIPDGWSGEIISNELSIDDIEKIWEY
jgi:hypothetical protein